MLDDALRLLPERPVVATAIAELRRLAEHARQAHPRTRVGFDLADSSGYAYYSGARFAAYARGASDAIARGGRYDEVGAIFGRNRPAVGFGLDVKDLALLSAAPPARESVRAPGRHDAALRVAVRELRASGEVVVSDFDGHDAGKGAAPARRLVETGGRWAVSER